MANSSYNFTMIDSDAFVVQNCDHLVKIWHYIKYNKTEDSRHGLAYGNKNDVYSYIIEGFNDYLTSDSLEKPPETQEFWDWSIGLYRPLTDEGLSECPSQMCRAIGWKGSPDLAGIGMLATYTTQAILVTFYLFSILEIRLEWLPPRLRKSRMISRTLLAAQHSTAEFLSASSIFSVSLLAASIHSVVRNNSINRSMYILALVIPLNSIFPAVILNVVASSMLRRSRGRVLFWLLIEVLTIALVALGTTIPATVDSTPTNEDGLFWNQNPCVESLFFKTTIFSFIVTAALLLGIIAYVLDSLISMIRHRPGLAARLPNMVQWWIIGISLSIMWFFVGWLVNLAKNIESRTGGNNSDTEWTFGQVLALATWVPTMVEFAYIWWEEPLRALNGRLMAPYEVVATSMQESLLEIGSCGMKAENGRFQRL